MRGDRRDHLLPLVGPTYPHQCAEAIHQLVHAIIVVPGGGVQDVVDLLDPPAEGIPDKGRLAGGVDIIMAAGALDSICARGIGLELQLVADRTVGG